MTAFYLRWAGVIVVATLLAIFTSRHYEQNLASVSPELVLSGNHSQTNLRVQGMIKSGSLSGNPGEGHAQFELLGESKNLKVRYQGPPPENLRELKTLILIGRWDEESQVYLAHETALITNYGFVASAYVVALISLMVFLFVMSRKVTFLYQEIKESKLYEPELDSHVDQR